MDIQEEQKERRDSGFHFFSYSLGQRQDFKHKGQIIRITSGREEKEGLKMRNGHDEKKKETKRGREED